MPSKPGNGDESRNRDIKATIFAPTFDNKFSLVPISIEAMTLYVTTTLNAFLGFEDDIVIGLIINNLTKCRNDHVRGLEGIDPKSIALDLEGFLGKEEALSFVGVMWEEFRKMSASISASNAVKEVVAKYKKDKTASTKAGE